MQSCDLLSIETESVDDETAGNRATSVRSRWSPKSSIYTDNHSDNRSILFIFYLLKADGPKGHLHCSVITYKKIAVKLHTNSQYN